MCALKFPFKTSGKDYVTLGRLIKNEDYDDIPGCFSADIRVLLSHLLAKDPKKRPNINQIFKFPLVKEMIPKVLNLETFKDEFTHTILHG